MKCSIRPHPRYSNLKLINDIFKDTNINIEDAKKVSVESSMENTENIIGLKSTVLLQAYYGGRQIILDDLSDINLFNVLHDSGYILLKKEYKLLSDVINCHKKGGD